MTSDHGADGLVGLDGIAHVALEQIGQPHEILDIEGLIQPQRGLLGFDGRLGNPGALKHLQGISRHTHDGVVDDGDSDQRGDGDQNAF